MKKLWILALPAVLLAILLTACGAAPAAAPAAGSTAAPAPEPDPEPALNFTVYDDSGEAVSLSDLAGTPVVVNFWATWCGPCRAELPDFDEAQAAYGDRIRFLMVDLINAEGQSADYVRSFLKTNGLGFPVYYDAENSGAETFSISAIPLTVFIGPDGTVRGQHVGTISRAALEDGLEDLLTTIESQKG